jgi:carbon-monoxide dehydrogenase large subunit
MISATELHRCEIGHMETPTPYHAPGAEGRGASGTIGSRSAVQNAVAHLGVRHIQVPTTSQRVWKVIAEAQGGSSR